MTRRMRGTDLPNRVQPDPRMGPGGPLARARRSSAAWIKAAVPARANPTLDDSAISRPVFGSTVAMKAKPSTSKLPSHPARGWAAAQDQEANQEHWPGADQEQGRPGPGGEVERPRRTWVAEQVVVPALGEVVAAVRVICVDAGGLPYRIS